MGNANPVNREALPWLATLGVPLIVALKLLRRSRLLKSRTA